jgi:two-component system LytT family response regulator
MMIKVFLVDDEFKAIQTLQKALETFFSNVLVVGTASAIDDAYDGILESKPHVVFLDIEMGDESGFQLLEKFESIDFHVAFVTAHEEFALKAIKFSAIDYILKPAALSDLKALLKKVEENPISRAENMKVKQLFGNLLSEDKDSHKITIPIPSGYEFVKVIDVYYLRASGSYTDFYMKDGTKFTTTKNLKYFESILEGYGFYRIHNSTLINIKYIKQINKSAGGYVVMENDAELSISKSRKNDFMKALALS